jgi:xylan 1,4-beta-xylosidase
VQTAALSAVYSSFVRNLFSLLLLVVNLITPSWHLQAQQPFGDATAIDVHLDRSSGSWTPIYNWFGYDEINYTTTNGRKLLGELHDLSPVPVYIRAHSLLNSGDGTPELKWGSTGVYREGPEGQPIYDFTIVDRIFDAYKTAGVRPMVELGFMPQDLAAALPDRKEPYQVHFPQNTVSGASNNPPKDYAKWEELVRKLVAHLVDRYGREQVSQWYFEVWNEPDIFYWHTTPEAYWKLYDFAVDGVRKALPEARVGGPATTGPGGNSGAAFLQGFLEHVSTGVSAATGRPVPLDFVSFHAKGQPNAKEGGGVVMGLRQEIVDVDRGLTIIEHFPSLKGLPVILSEADPEGCAACSAKTNPANAYRNGTLYPTYTAAAYSRILELAKLHHANVISMLSWSFEFEDKEYFEGFRSLATNGVDKPVLNLFRMLGLMQGDSVEASSESQVPISKLMESGVREGSDVGVLATRNGKEVAVMVWNYHDDAEAARATPVVVSVDGLPKGVKQVNVTEFRIDHEHSNAYTAWLALGSPQEPTAEQVAELRRRGGLDLIGSPRWVEANSTGMRLSETLPGESVSLFMLRW